jgi:hypothetical protein
MAKAQQPDKVPFRERLKQIRTAFTFTARHDRWFVPLLVVAMLVPLVAAGVAVALGAGWLYLLIGIMFALVAAMGLLSLRANKAALSEAQGQPGAAAWVVETMRGDWRLNRAVASTTQFDMVHLVVSRSGVILLGEGNPQRVRGLIGQEKRRVGKVIGNADLRDFVVGDGEGEIPLNKLRVTLMKLPRTITTKEVVSLDRRLKALTAARPQMPKGAIPKSMRPQGMRVPRRGR